MTETAADSETFTDWTSDNSLPTDSGSYQLTTDVTLNAEWDIPDNTDITLDLNGHKIQPSASYSGTLIGMYEPVSRLSLSDSVGTGTITGAKGGALYTEGGTFRMYGGSITGNTGTASGGIQCYGGTVQLYGGSITNNSATKPSGYHGAGVCLEEGVLAVSGDVTITGNTHNGSASNVCLTDGTVLTFLGDGLSDTARLGIHTQSAPTASQPVVLTDGYNGKAAMGNFTVDSTGRGELCFQYGELYLTSQPTLSFDANGGTGRMESIAGSNTVALPYCAFTSPENQVFDHWLVNGVELQPEETVRLTGNVVATAVYQNGDAWDFLRESLIQGKEEELSEDISCDADSRPLVIPAGVTSRLKLNGHTLHMTVDAVSVGHITVKGTLYVTGAPAESGTIYGGHDTRGGIFYVEDGASLTADKVTFSGGLSDNGGGGIYVAGGGKLSMTKAEVNGCAAKNNGGGIYAEDDAKLMVLDSSIYDNESGFIGGGLFLKATERCNIINSKVYNNCAKQSAAGGIYIDKGAKGSFTSLSVTGNRSENGVGGVHCGSSELSWAGSIKVCDNIEVLVELQGYQNVPKTDENGNILTRESNLKPFVPMKINGLSREADIGIDLSPEPTATPVLLTGPFQDKDEAIFALTKLKLDDDYGKLVLGVDQDNQIYAGFNIVPGTQTITAKPANPTLLMGKTATLTVTGQKGALTFSSSNTKVATVTSAGVIKGVGPGSATITVKAKATQTFRESAAVKVNVKVKCAQPVVQKQTIVKGGVQVKGVKPAGASVMRVFCKAGSGNWKPIGYTKSNTFTAKTYDGKHALKSGVKYYFGFRVVDKAGSSNYLSDMSKASVYTYYTATPAFSSVTNTEKSTVRLSWKKVTGVTGYQVQVSASKSFTKLKQKVTLTGAKKTGVTLTELTKGKVWYFRMRTYVKKSGKTYYSPWSAVKKLKVTK